LRSALTTLLVPASKPSKHVHWTVTIR